MKDKNYDHSKLNENSKEWVVNQRCIHPEHNPPNMLCIPSGQSYTHICPACKKKQVIRGGGEIFM